MFLLHGHTNGVRAATWDPSGTMLVRTSLRPDDSLFLTLGLPHLRLPQAKMVPSRYGRLRPSHLSPRPIPSTVCLLRSTPSECLLLSWSLCIDVCLYKHSSHEFMCNVAAVWHPNGRYFVIPSKIHGRHVTFCTLAVPLSILSPRPQKL